MSATRQETSSAGNCIRCRSNGCGLATTTGLNGKEVNGESAVRVLLVLSNLIARDVSRGMTIFKTSSYNLHGLTYTHLRHHVAALTMVYYPLQVHELETVMELPQYFRQLPSPGLDNRRLRALDSALDGFSSSRLHIKFIYGFILRHACSQEMVHPEPPSRTLSSLKINYRSHAMYD